LNVFRIVDILRHKVCPCLLGDTHTTTIELVKQEVGLKRYLLADVFFELTIYTIILCSCLKMMLYVWKVSAAADVNFAGESVWRAAFSGS